MMMDIVDNSAKCFMRQKVRMMINESDLQYIDDGNKQSWKTPEVVVNKETKPYFTGD